MDTVTKSPSAELLSHPVEGSKGMPAAEAEIERLQKVVAGDNPLSDIVDGKNEFIDMEELTRQMLVELDYLRYFHQEADFGPADDDVRWIIQENYTGPIPEGYEIE